MEISSFVGLIPKITEWMESEEYATLSKALKYIKELELKQHVPHVINCWHEKKYADLRKECLFLLIEWQFGQIGRVLDEALNDENIEIFCFALDYLSKHGYAETVPTLKRLLKASSVETQNLVLKALAASNDKNAATIIFDFAKENLFNKPFKEFQNWSQREEKYHHQVMKDLEDKDFAVQDQKRASYVRIFRTVIDSLGYLNCKESSPWLMQIVDDPMSIGFETKDYNQLNSFFSSYFSVFESACKSLGILGIGDKNVTDLLVRKIEASPEEYQQCIINTLGDLGDLRAESALMPFVSNIDHIFFYDAMLALSKLKSNRAFGPIAKAYLRNIHGMRGNWAEAALRRINPLAFEKILLDQIKSRKNDDEIKNYFLSILVPIASIRSSDALFPVLTDPELSGNASWVLWKIADNESVRNRALALLKSENPLEKAAAVSILEDYFKRNMSELEKFKNDDSAEVRRAVLGIYYENDFENEVKEYANDPDEQIRDSVFLFFASSASYRGHCLMASDSEEFAQCGILIQDKSIILQLPEKIIFIPKEFVKKSQITSNEDNIFGVYIQIAEETRSPQRMLLVPLDRFIGAPEEMAQWLLSEIKCPVEPQTSDDSMVKDLWKEIPKDMLPKNGFGRQEFH